MANGAKAWIRVGEAADRLGLSQGTVRNYARAGRLDVRRLPSGHRRISAASVERLREQIYVPEPGPDAESGPGSGEGGEMPADLPPSRPLSVLGEGDAGESSGESGAANPLNAKRQPGEEPC